MIILCNCLLSLNVFNVGLYNVIYDFEHNSFTR